MLDAVSRYLKSRLNPSHYPYERSRFYQFHPIPSPGSILANNNDFPLSHMVELIQLIRSEMLIWAFAFRRIAPSNPSQQTHHKGSSHLPSSNAQKIRNYYDIRNAIQATVSILHGEDIGRSSVNRSSH